MIKVTENRYIINDGEANKNWNYYVRYLIAIFCEMVYKLLFLKQKSFPAKKYHISICSCFKNEARFFKEWIEYHMLMGVEHFYLYNNNSDDNYHEVLQDYINKGIVTLEEFPDIPAQPGVYKHWYENYRHETDWVSFLDLDEFFVPLKHDNLNNWLEEHGRYPLLLVYWKMFGTSGFLKHDDNKLVTEQYNVSWNKLYGVGKQLYNTNYDIVALERGSMHGMKVWHNGFKIPPMNVFGHFVIFGINRTTSQKVDIQLNHYWSKAFDIYELKHKRGSGAFGKSWKTFDWFLFHEKQNMSSDFSIYRFMIELKLKMIGKYPKNIKE